MKIVFFTNEYAHPKLPSSGGVGSFLKTMAEAMTKLGHEVHVYGFSKKNNDFKDQGITFKFFKKYSKQFPVSEFLRSLSSKLPFKNAELYFLKKERLYLAKQLKDYCKQNHIDIIESFTFNGFTAYWDNSTPLVNRFHGSRGFWHHYLGAKKEEHKIHMEQLALENTTYTVAVSKFSANAVKEIYNVDVDKVIYNGIDANHFSPNPDIKVIDQSVFYYGTISKAKGVDKLCLIFNDVIIKHPNATLHLIGRGNEYLEQLKASVLSVEASNRMTYYGPKHIEELPALLNQASILVFPSLNESFGLIIAESMALQKLVIASDIPSFNEIIVHGEDGFIAENNQAFVSLINDVFEKPETYETLRKKARETIITNFTQELMTQKSIEYYKHILNT